MLFELFISRGVSFLYTANVNSTYSVKITNRQNPSSSHSSTEPPAGFIASSTK